MNLLLSSRKLSALPRLLDSLSLALSFSLSLFMLLSPSVIAFFCCPLRIEKKTRTKTKVLEKKNSK